MAGQALQCFVRPGQAKFGPGIVVELPEIPTVRIVTSGAVVPELLFVFVVPFVAGDAVAPNIFEGGLDMTTFTGGHRMQTDQWKSGQVMFKFDVDSPATLVVAVVAIFSLLSAMCII
jgi:hypothetical protein